MGNENKVHAENEFLFSSKIIEIVKFVRKRWNQSIFYDYMSIKFRVKFSKFRFSALSENITELPRTNYFPLKICD